MGTTILDAARGFDGNVTQPRTQSVFNATLSYAFLDAARWAAKNQAADQVGIARIAAEDTRRQVAVTAAEAYLAVIAAQRQVEIAVRNLDTARALEEYARARLEAGKGSRLNHVRSTQELAAAEGRLQLAELLLRQGPGGPGRGRLRRRSPRCGRRSRAEAGGAAVLRRLAAGAPGRPAREARSCRPPIGW